MCMGFAKEIKAWVCVTEQNQRDGMLQAWADSMAGMDNQAMVFPGNTPAVAGTVDAQLTAHSAPTADCASQS